MFRLQRGPALDRVVDVGIALVLMSVAMVELAFWQHDGPTEVRWWSYVLALAMTVPLVMRRARPGEVMGLVGTAGLVAPVLGTAMPTAGALGIVVALYSVAAWGSHQDAIWSGVITIGVLLFVAVRYWEFMGLAGAAANYLIFSTGWVLGWATRNRRLLLDELTARAELAEQTREQEARRAVVDERARIARELHDLVAHTVSVMVVQAGAARRQLDRTPAAAAEAIGQVERTGRDALEELRRLLGVLREDARDASEELAPQPTLRAIGSLAGTLQSAGLPVEVTTEGSLDDLPPGVDVSAYRIVQEALTNVLKHAGSPTSVRVAVRRADERLDVEVSDDGRGAGADQPGPDGAGHGLVGMRERVAVYGGDFEAGPRRGGGYLVRASFPFRTPARAAR